MKKWFVTLASFSVVTLVFVLSVSQISLPQYFEFPKSESKQNILRDGVYVVL